ncbi:MAG: hypothetical protein OXE42_12745 [Gammaproteobacteria bacterium]|nr:hypothetical protein [Gammaproteobacteria bacterium]
MLITAIEVFGVFYRSAMRDVEPAIIALDHLRDARFARPGRFSGEKPLEQDEQQNQHQDNY